MPLQGDVQVTLEFYGQTDEATAEYHRLYDTAMACGISVGTDYRDDVDWSIGSGSADGGSFRWDFTGSVDRVSEFLLRAFQTEEPKG